MNNLNANLLNLCAHGLDADASTPLHHACFNGHYDVVNELIWHHANVLATNNRGLSALHFAAHRGHLGIVELLARAGATQSLDDFEENRLKNVKRAIARLVGMNGTIGQRLLLERWRGVLEVHRGSQSSYHKATKRFIYGNLSKLFDGWRKDAKQDAKGKWIRGLLWFVWKQLRKGFALLRQELHMFRVCTRVCRMVIQDAIHVVFVQWRQVAQGIRMEKMRMILVRLMKQELAIVFWDWRYLAYSHWICRRVAGKMLNQKISIAFEEWREVAAQIKADKMKKFLMRMLHSTYSRAMDKWLTSTRETRRIQKAVGGAVTRMLQRQLSAAFEKWQAEAAQLKADRNKMKRALVRMFHKRLAVCFLKWVKEAAQGRKHRGIIHRMLQNKLSMAFEKLQADAAATVRAKSDTNRAIAKLLLGESARGFYTMRDYARRQRELKSAWRSWLTCLRNDARLKHDERVRLMFDDLFTGGSTLWANSLAGEASIKRVAPQGRHASKGAFLRSLQPRRDL